jgi:myo-inositol-1-phosphate synthase
MTTRTAGEPGRGRLGVLMVGVGGSIASTVVAGTALMRRDRVARTGMLTETGRLSIGGSLVSVRQHMGLDDLGQLHFGGWDVVDTSLYDSCLRAGVVRRDLLDSAREDLESVRPMPGVDPRRYVKNVNASHVSSASSLWEAAEKVREQIRDFAQSAQADRLVVVNVGSTEGIPDLTAVALQDPDEFVKGLKASSPSISPAMIYFYAALMEGVPHVNFTPSNAEVPALRALAQDKKVLFCGRDGKTGQTLLKTVLAPAFRARQLRIDGWFSTNILGNGDGKVLSDPASLEAKIETKTSVLDDMLGYRVGEGYDAPSHVVAIHYYPPRGDAKEAWDNIDLVGFLEMPMQVKVNFLCRDSILAAPLVIDLLRLARHGADHGVVGNFDALSMFFKDPLKKAGTRAVHDFFLQQELLAKYILGDARSEKDSLCFW